VVGWATSTAGTLPRNRLTTGARLVDGSRITALGNADQALRRR
jgi:hypothetical protein